MRALLTALFERGAAVVPIPGRVRLWHALMLWIALGGLGWAALAFLVMKAG